MTIKPKTDAFGNRVFVVSTANDRPLGTSTIPFQAGAIGPVQATVGNAAKPVPDAFGNYVYVVGADEKADYPNLYFFPGTAIPFQTGATTALDQHIANANPHPQYALASAIDWSTPGAIGSNTPNTGRFTQLSTGTIHLIEKQLRPQLREIIRTNGLITRVSIYSDSSKVVELYRKTLNRTSGTLTSITETDYTTNPPTTRTKTLTRSSGQITTVEVA